MASRPCGSTEVLTGRPINKPSYSTVRLIHHGLHFSRMGLHLISGVMALDHVLVTRRLPVILPRDVAISAREPP
jgi:hypothetical protein